MHLESKCKVQIPESYYKGIWIVGVLHPDHDGQFKWIDIPDRCVSKLRTLSTNENLLKNYVCQLKV